MNPAPKRKRQADSVEPIHPCGVDRLSEERPGPERGRRDEDERDPGGAATIHQEEASSGVRSGMGVRVIPGTTDYTGRVTDLTETAVAVASHRWPTSGCASSAGASR